MIGWFRFRWYFSRKQFARALAALPSGKLPALALYAFYRLSMYRTVMTCAVQPVHWRDQLAHCISLLACGRSNEARVAMQTLVATPSFEAHRAQCVEAVAAFSPALAAEWINETVSPGLRAALLIKTGKREQAQVELDAALSTGLYKKTPELHLHASNAVRAGPSGQLQALNAFLGTYGLSPLSLLNKCEPVGPLNLVSHESLPAVDGPLVSILMTAYQAEHHVGAALQSLLQQTYRHIEIIVVDDASTDRTGDVVATFAQKDARVRYVRLPRNVGTYVAKNIGLRYAKGEFATCHDADDWSHPLRIARQVQPLLDDQALVFTTSFWVRIDDDGVFHARQTFPLLRLNPASPLFRIRPVLEKAGVWDMVRTGADSEFSARLALVFGTQARRRIAEPLTLGAHRQGSLMTATNTGYDAEGLSPVRLSYWEAWSQHHLDCLRRGKRLYFSDDPLAEREFDVPENIRVSRDDIAFCMKSLGIPSVPSEV